MNFVLIPNQIYESLNIQTLAAQNGFNLAPRANKAQTHKALHVGILDQLGNNVLLTLLELSKDDTNNLLLVEKDYLQASDEWNFEVE